MRSSQNDEEDSSKGDCEGEAEISDMEGSQVSLPRSYTLPREFKYNNSNNQARERRGPASKLQPSRFYLPSTNSSDGMKKIHYNNIIAVPDTALKILACDEISLNYSGRALRRANCSVKVTP